MGKERLTGRWGWGLCDDENWQKLGIIEVNAVNETEMWDAGG